MLVFRPDGWKPTVRVGTLALLGLAGCGGTPVFNVDYDAVYLPGETRANGPDITVLVRGNPSALPKAEFDRTVTDAMQGWSFWPDHFTTGGDPNGAYRVVVIFNPPPTIRARHSTLRRELLAAPTSRSHSNSPDSRNRAAV